MCFVCFALVALVWWIWWLVVVIFWVVFFWIVVRYLGFIKTLPQMFIELWKMENHHVKFR